MSIIIISFLYAVPVLTLESGESVYLGKRALRFFFCELRGQNQPPVRESVQCNQSRSFGPEDPLRTMHAARKQQRLCSDCLGKALAGLVQFQLRFCVSPLTLAISYLLFKGMGELCCILQKFVGFAMKEHTRHITKVFIENISNIFFWFKQPYSNCPYFKLTKNTVMCIFILFPIK